MTKSISINKDSEKGKTEKITFETNAERRAKIELVKKEKGFQTIKEVMESFIDQTAFLNPELLKKVDSFFIEGNHEQKLFFIVDAFLKWHEKFPYLTALQPITPESAGFLPLECVKPIYRENKFLGFQCIIKGCPIDLPRISLKESSGHRIILKITTPELCSACVELSKKQKVGLDPFGHISLDQITLYKANIKLSKEPESERALNQKLHAAGIRRNYKEVKTIFQHLTYAKNTKEWKGISEASRRTGISRPTIYKLIEIFPEGIR